jgi:cell wall-associated NlpC family hydrolase
MAGVDLPDTRAYPIPCRPGQILKLLAAAGFVEVEVEDMRPGDVLVFWISRPDRPRHMALYLGGFEMMSTDAGQKASVRSLTSGLRDRIHSVHRWSQ